MKSLKIVMMVDLSEPPPWDHDYTEYLKLDDWESENCIYKTLKKLGHEVKIFGIYDQITPFVDLIKTHPPDLVFNMCESFKNDRNFESHLVSILEILGVRYTGSGSFALQLCKDKGLTKKILNYHRVSIPKFLVSKKIRPLRTLKKFDYPAFIKPLGFEGSEGIAQMSFAETEKEALERISYIHEKLKTDVIVEEYIDGREIYIGVIGNDRLNILPPREVFFENIPDEEPKFATFKAKWDEKYRKKWGIRNGPAKEISDKSLLRMNEICKKVYRLFHLRGYARIDLRMKENGEVFFIEANPNPSIARGEDFAAAAEKSGIDYDALIEKIVSYALN